MSFHRCPRHWTLQQRLRHYSIRDPKTECVLWTGYRDPAGYGRLTHNGPLLAHRAAWIVRHGPIPKGLFVCHKCDVRACLNPKHLFLGTHQENMADMAAKMRRERGIENGPERRPDKSPEILRIEMLGREFVTRVLAIRPLTEVSGRTPPATNRPSPSKTGHRPRRRSAGREGYRRSARDW